MKALSFTQPWATLVAIGAKKIETRSWDTRYRGPLAIHSSPRWQSGLDIWSEHPFHTVLLRNVFEKWNLPLGTVLVICLIVGRLRCRFVS
jgi:activating signal cointegrator 1